MSRRVVITGVGVVSPIGIGKENFWQSLSQGKSGIDQITLFDPQDFPSKIAGEVKHFDPHQFLEPKKAKRMDRFTQFALVAAQEAVADAKLQVKASNASQVGVIIGSGIGGLRTLEEQLKVLLSKGPRRVSPFLIPMIIDDIAAGQVAIEFGATGPNWAPVSACSSGAHAIGEAYETIKRGASEIIITGGAEAPVTPLSVAAFSSARALSTRNDEPQKASRPFDKDRDGFVIAEGAGIVILESLESANSRKVPIYGEIIGYGATADAYHITAPDPEGKGAAQAMRLALAEASLKPEDISYINAHGTSTPLGDEFETLAIRQVFGKHAYRLFISSTKSMTGHLLGAAGGLEFIASLLTLKNGIIPPTINLDNPDSLCDLNFVPHVALKKETEVILSNSFAFGGHNVTLIAKKFS